MEDRPAKTRDSHSNLCYLGSPAPFPGLLLGLAHWKSQQGPSHVTQEARSALSRAQHILFAPVQSVAMLIMWQPRVPV